MNNILFIVYDMIPYASSWGSSQRMYFLAKKLISKNCRVDVVALNKANYNTYNHEVPFNTTHIQSSLFLEETNNGLINRVIRGGAYRICRILNKYIYNEIFFMTGFLTARKIRIAKTTIQSTLNANQYDAVIISGPPFTLFSLIPFIKKICTDVKIVMDYRDPWNSWHKGSWYTQNREKKYQILSDLIVCTNDALCKDMSEKYAINPNKYKVSANGYVNEKVISSMNVLLSANKFNIVYAGDISFSVNSQNGYRDTTNLIIAVKQLINDGLNDICLTFVGVKDPTSNHVEHIKSSLGDAVNIIGKVGTSEAKSFVQHADACLVLHTINDDSGKFLISGKVYDYIQAKKFMLSISNEDSQHAMILKENHIGLNATNNVADIKNIILEARGKWESGELNKGYDNMDISKYSREYQLDIYYDILNKLIV